MPALDLKKLGAPKLEVDVSQEHIDDAIRGISSHCMAKEAIKEGHPQFTHIAVDLQSIRITERAKGVRYIYLTPRKVQQAIVYFDQGLRMRPFKFKLKGGHTVASYMTNKLKGKPARERVKLGKQQLVSKRREIPDVIGGKPTPPPLAKHPSASSIRRFGVGAFTNEKTATWPPKGTGLTKDDDEK